MTKIILSNLKSQKVLQKIKMLTNAFIILW